MQCGKSKDRLPSKCLWVHYIRRPAYLAARRFVVADRIIFGAPGRGASGANRWGGEQGVLYEFHVPDSPVVARRFPAKQEATKKNHKRVDQRQWQASRVLRS